MAWIKDRWETPDPDIYVLNSRTLESLSAKRMNNNALTERYPVTENEKDVTIVFIYDGTIFGGEPLKDHAPSVFCRVAKRAMHGAKNAIRQIYFLPFEASDDLETNFDILLDRIDHIYDLCGDDSGPVVLMNVSRKAYGFISSPKEFSGIEPLRLLNRLGEFRFGNEKHEAVMSIPDRNVLRRNEFGKISKDNQTLVGEWFYAIRAALDGNRYDIDDDGYTYEIIRTEKQWEKFLDELWAAKKPGIDTETENLNRLANRLACIQISCDGSHAYIIPFDHPDITLPQKFRKRIEDDLREYFEYGKSEWHCYANAKFDLIQIIRELKLRWYNHAVFDVQGAQQQLDENRKFRSSVMLVEEKKMLPGFALDQLVIERGCHAYLRSSMGKEERANIFGQPFESVAEYGGLDAILTYRIHESQIAEALDRGDNYSKFVLVVTGQINSMIRAFVKMELTGLPIDRAYLASQQSATTGEFEKSRAEHRAKLYAMDTVKQANKILLKRKFGSETDLFGTSDKWVFDIDIIEHQQVLFFEVMGLTPTKVGKNGLPSTDKTFKAEYAPKDDDGKYLETALEEVQLFAEYGEFKHLFNSFMKSFYKKLFTSPDMRIDGRIRPEFKYLSIVTGRTGAGKPSLQNIPSRSKLAKVVKRQFITKPGSIYVKADFDSHEVRNWGISSGENNLVASYTAGMVAKRQFRLLDVTTPEDWKVFEAAMKPLDLHRQNCLSGDTLVQSDRGLLRMDDKNLLGATVMCVDGPAKVVNHIHNGVRKVIKITTADGKQIKLTPDHRVKAFDNSCGEFVWRKAGSLTVGDNLMGTLQNLPHPDNYVFELQDYPKMTGRGARATFISKKITRMTPDLAYLMGIIVTEGHIRYSKHYHFLKGNAGGSYVEITNTDLNVLRECKRIFSEIFGYESEIQEKKVSLREISGVQIKTIRPAYKFVVGSHDVVYKLQQLGLTKENIEGRPSYTTRVPNSIFKADAESQKAFIAGCIDGDGCVNPYTQMNSSSLEFVKDMAQLCHGLSIVVRIAKPTLNRSGKNLYRLYLCDGVDFHINDYSFKQSNGVNSAKFPSLFWKQILSSNELYDINTGETSISDDNEPRTRGWMKRRVKVFTDHKGKKFYINGSTNYLEKTYSIRVHDRHAYSDNIEYLLKRCDPSSYKKLRYLKDNLFYGSEITSIEDAGEENVYDLTIEKGKDPSFIANGVMVHNCRHFFGIDPSEVTKAQRSKVKTTVFGVVYGMSAMRLAVTLNISEDEAQELIDKLFEKFPDGSAFISITHQQGRKYLVCVSGIGRVRHMWGYLHLDRGVHGGMDRRGPNSMIQGIASDEGMEANYQLQERIWRLFHSQDIPYELEICNTVHDSTETISPIVTAPIACYLIEHAGSTLIHKRYSKRYGVEFNVGLELGFELGPSLGEMDDWNYRPEQLEVICRKAAEWSHKNLGYDLLTDKQWKAFKHNNEMMFEIRQDELRDTPKNGVSTHMYFGKAEAREIALA